MPGIITSKGLDDLVELKTKKLTLPEGWEMDVERYVQLLECLKTELHIAYLKAQNHYIETVKKQKVLYGR